MSYVALYRKFRPTDFTEVKGQDHIVTVLRNQVRLDRIGHAYLFCGTRGTGKTTAAKIFAKAVNCQNPQDGNPCGECEICKSIGASTSMNVIEIDAASNNGVDNIREIRENASYSPTEGRYKVYIIDEVHMLSIGAFNALLKILEEPPEYVIFILATTEVHKIPITILSRCQRYDFKRITVASIVSRLEELMDRENIETEEKALAYIARAADGSMRDALSLLDQCIAFYLGKKLTYNNVLEVLGALDTDVYSAFLRKLLERNTADVMKSLDDIVMQGTELTQFVTDFIQYLRNLLFVKSGTNLEDMLDVSGENLKQLKEEAQMADEETLIRFIRIFSDLSGDIRLSSQKRVLVEVALIKMCHPTSKKDYSDLADRIDILEKKLEQGVPVAQSPVEIPKPQVEITRVKACSQDVQKVIQNWNSIIKGISPPARNYLKDHKDFRETTEGTLQIIMSDSLAAGIISEESNLRELKNIISEKIGKDIIVEVLSLEEDGKEVKSLIDVDYINSVIHADIKIEEE